MFLKEKFTADGLFEKIKVRLVAGDHLQDRQIYHEEIYDTVSASSVFSIESLAVSSNRAVAWIDFAGAFLNVDMSEEGTYVALMRLDKFLTSASLNNDDLFVSVD